MGCGKREREEVGFKELAERMWRLANPESVRWAGRLEAEERLVG